jgi:hypothetical protein
MNKQGQPVVGCPKGIFHYSFQSGPLPSIKKNCVFFKVNGFQ